MIITQQMADAIVEETRRGCYETLGRLMFEDEFINVVKRYNYLSGNAELDDACQMARLKVLQEIADFIDKRDANDGGDYSGMAAWMYTVIRNRMYDEGRRKKRLNDSTVYDDELIDRTVDNHTDAYQSIDDRETIKDALDIVIAGDHKIHVLLSWMACGAAVLLHVREADVVKTIEEDFGERTLDDIFGFILTSGLLTFNRKQITEISSRLNAEYEGRRYGDRMLNEFYGGNGRARISDWRYRINSAVIKATKGGIDKI